MDAAAMFTKGELTRDQRHLDFGRGSVPATRLPQNPLKSTWGWAPRHEHVLLAKLAGVAKLNLQHIPPLDQCAQVRRPRLGTAQLVRLQLPLDFIWRTSIRRKTCAAHPG